jgi:hypothetical protein
MAIRKLLAAALKIRPSRPWTNHDRAAFLLGGSCSQAMDKGSGIADGTVLSLVNVLVDR